MTLYKLGGLFLLVLLVGCDSNSDFNDLQQFLDAERAKPRGVIEPLPAVIPYEAFTYAAAGLRSPFQLPEKALLAQKQKGSLAIKPDESRVKQFLEGFNIDTFSMVGTLSNARGNFALIQGEGGVYRVKVGDYLGTNHGRIVDINDSEIQIVEIVTDGDQGWLERPRTLTLREHS